MRTAVCSAIAMVALVCAVAVRAQGPAPTPLASPSGSPPAVSKAIETPAKSHALTRDDLEAFLDALIPSQLENRNGAGAVVGVVKDGQVLLTKGYGYADFGNRKPVVASETLFRPGSISKLFTATAVMQLVEQGKLDLDHDVSEYIDFAIPKTYAEPVTLRRLLTHTGGFEETLKNLFVPSATAMRPLRDYLVAAMPARIFPPGKVPSYSNWGLSLAGYIVERASGERFDEYVARHILAPLRMEHSTFAQPLPDTLAKAMSNGYNFATDKPLPFEFVQAAPAGSLSSTADDMCRFMLALLGKGTLDGATILKPGTVEQMQSRQFEAHADLSAIGLIFMQYPMNGLLAWGHGGDTIAFHSDLWLVPEAQFGFFVSYNSAAPRPGGGRAELQRALADRYFAKPPAEDSTVTDETARADAKAVSGTYTSSRRSETTFLKLAALFGQAVVQRNPDSTISIDISKNARGQLKRWREIAPLVYAEVNGRDKIAFRRDASGQVVELLTQPPVSEAQRVPWQESKALIVPVVGGCVGFILATLLLWPVAAIVRRRHGRLLFPERNGGGLFVASRIVFAIVGLWLLILIVVGSRAGTDISLLGDGLNGTLHILHALGWLTVAGLGLLIIAAAKFWRAASTGWWLRIHATLLALATCVFVLFMWHFHLLSTSMKF